MRKVYGNILLCIIVFSLCGCTLSSTHDRRPNPCPTTPIKFTVSDLIGTWKAGWSERNDTLILREDGTYKQIIYVASPPFDYESEWLTWNVELSNHNIPYVHLKGMRLCVYWEGIDCSQIGGAESEWLDFCDGKWTKMPGEGILIVMGTPDGFIQPPRGISLFALQKHLEGATSYELQQPQ